MPHSISVHIYNKMSPIMLIHCWAELGFFMQIELPDFYILSVFFLWKKEWSFWNDKLSGLPQFLLIDPNITHFKKGYSGFGVKF